MILKSNMENSPKSALRISKINDSQIDQLIELTKSVLKESGSHKADYIEKVWYWNYKDLPSKKSDAVVGLSGGEMLGYVHIVYLKAHINGLECLAAIMQDGGVSKRARGKGLWKKITQFTENEIVENGTTIIYAFPNVKAIHTWKKYNQFEEMFVYRTYILPIDGSALIKSKINVPILSYIAGKLFEKSNNLFLSPKKSDHHFTIIKDEIDFDSASLYLKYSKRFSISILRTKEFINWRYFNKPIGEHFAVNYINNKEILASAIFKIDHVLGVNTLLMMDFAYEENQEDKIGYILRFIKDNYKRVTEEKISLIFTAFYNEDFLQNKKYGFIRIPDKLNPRVMPFLSKNIRAIDGFMDPNKWHTTLGEWDVF